MSLETPNAFADEENILLHTALFKQVSPAEAEEQYYAMLDEPAMAA